MTITTLDGIIAGFQPPQFYFKSSSGTLTAGKPFTPFYTAGIPCPAVAPTSGLSGAALTSYPGQLPFTNPSSGNSYLAKFAGATNTTIGTFLLCDRLWHNSGISVTTTTAQTINSASWPPRDNNGASNGEGILIGLEISTGTGAGTATPTISYTNQAGISGQIGQLVHTYTASAIQGSFYPFQLSAGDTGVQSVQSITLGTSMTSGTIHLVAYRILAVVGNGNVGAAASIDPLTGGLPIMYNNTVPFILFIPGGTAATSLSGQMIVTQG